VQTASRSTLSVFEGTGKATRRGSRHGQRICRGLNADDDHTGSKYEKGVPSRDKRVDQSERESRVTEAALPSAILPTFLISG